MNARPEVARCEVCGDVVPVTSSGSGDVRPIRSEESWECDEEAFRLLSEVEVGDLSTETSRGEIHDETARRV